MFLNERAQYLIENIRDNDDCGANTYKAAISDAMSAIMVMYQMYAKSEHEKTSLPVGGIKKLYN